MVTGHQDQSNSRTLNSASNRHTGSQGSFGQMPCRCLKQGVRHVVRLMHRRPLCSEACASTSIRPTTNQPYPPPRACFANVFAAATCVPVLMFNLTILSRRVPSQSLKTCRDAAETLAARAYAFIYLTVSRQESYCVLSTVGEGNVGEGKLVRPR